MKRLLLLIATLMAVSATPAAATETAAVNCQHSDGRIGTIVSANHVKRSNGDVIGAVQLCRIGWDYWAYVIFYNPMPSGKWGIAYLNYYENGVREAIYSCDNAGGNKYVEPGQTRCWTPMIVAPFVDQTFMAAGVECTGIHPTCTTRTAVGFTARTA